MQLDFLIKGAILGFSIAAPVGPIGILCIRRTLQYGRLSGFSSGLGAAIADTLYGGIAAFGLTLISDFLVAQGFWLRLIGGAFLVYLGGKTFFSKTPEHPQKIAHTTLLSDFLSTLFLTLANPLTIVSFLAIFAALKLPIEENGSFSAFELVGGVFIGSALWWLILSQGVSLVRKKINPKVMTWINRIAGGIIVSFGLIAWLSLVN